MKPKLRFTTKLGNLLLILSVVLQIVFLVRLCMSISALQGDFESVMKGLTDILGFEIYMLFSSFAAPLLFIDMFTCQAKGQNAGARFGIIGMLVILALDNNDIIQAVISDFSLLLSNPQTVIYSLVIPAFFLLAILLNNRFLGLLGAVGALVLLVHNSSILSELGSVLNSTPVDAMKSCELLYWFGIFFGMLGIHKKPIYKEV